MEDTVSIEIPREVLHVTRMTPEELRQELAAHLFSKAGFLLAKPENSPV